MKVLIVIPKYSLSQKNEYNYFMPIGIGYIISVLKKAGHDVNCLNLNHLDGTVKELLIETLDKREYDVVGSGHMGLGYMVINKIVNAAKNHKSKPKVIIGGPIITSEPKLITEVLNIDFGIVGEGEITIIELLDCIEDNGSFEEVDGICYRNESGNFVMTKPRDVIKDLDSLPFPDFESMNLNEQLDNLSNGALYNYFDYPRLYQIAGGRGCPFQCTFCYHALGSKSYRKRSIDDILKEIKYAIERYRINCFFLSDDMFAAEKGRLKIFSHEVKIIIDELPYEFKWACSAPVTIVDEETFKMLKDAGCYWVNLGFESYSPTVLKSMRKPITPELIDRAIKTERKLKMPVIGNFIFGDIAETRKTAKETLDYWKENCDGQIALYFIQPYPGSEIFHHCVRNGIIKDKLDFLKNKIAHNNFYNMTQMNDEDYKEMVKEIFEAKREYGRYETPLKVEKTDKDRYAVHLKCPFCNRVIVYKNFLLANHYYYISQVICRNKDCHMVFFAASPLYKFAMDNYFKLSFLRKAYLFVKDRFFTNRL